MRDHGRKRSGFHTAFAIIVKIQRAGLGVKPDHAEQQSQVANAGGDKGLLGRRRRAGLMEPETNQQVTGQAHDFPRDEQEEQVVGNHHAEHSRGEQRQETEKPHEVRVMLHVANAENKNQHAHERHHHQHDRRQRIQDPANIHPLTAKLNPRETEYLVFQPLTLAEGGAQGA